MKRQALFHPVVFNDEEWAQGYYHRNKKNIEQVGKRLSSLLKKSDFKGGKILDVGCGFASVDIEIAKAFPQSEIIGIDMGEALMDIGRKLVREAGLENQIKLIKGDAHDLAFGDKEFDLVVNTFLLHIVENPVRC